MKVLHLIDHLGLGGAQSLLKDIFEAQRDNQDLFLFSLKNKGQEVSIDHPNVFKGFSNKIFPFKLFSQLITLINREKINIIHCHLIKAQVFGYLLKLLRFPEVNLVFHEHGIKKGERDPLIKMFTQKKVDLFLAVSHSMKNDLVTKCKIDPHKIQVLYNFVDLNKYNQQKITWNITKKRRQIGLSENDFVIGYAGRLVKHKGLFEFIQSADLLKNQFGMFKFLIVGNGGDKSVLLRTIDEKRLGDYVIFLGYQSDMVKFYSLLDCFVIPSYGEACSLTAIEAQAMGVPIIASNIPSLNETIHHRVNGLLFKIRDIQDLSNKILMIYHDENLRNKLIRNGITNSKSYSMTNYLKELDAIYQKAIVKLFGSAK